ncbi:MAG TPA: hypothetical protein VM141_03465, partial [Planctomycetota bacterium]|nr:hypothetical protein [Planctomycetota bacterium]
MKRTAFVVLWAVLAMAVCARCAAGEAAFQGAQNAPAAEQVLQPTPPAPADAPFPPVAMPKDAKVEDVSVKGDIQGENITFTLGFTVETKSKNCEIPLVTGDLVLDSVAEPAKGWKLRYDAAASTYYMLWAKTGTYKVSVIFAARPVAGQDGLWRRSAFAIPSSQVRTLEVACDRLDLEILFPGALRLERQEKDGKLTITAILGPGQPFAVAWKPQVAEMDAKLVLTCETNAGVTASAGALRMDSLFAFDVSQGKLTELEFSVPKSLSVTQVRGKHIRDWRIDAEGAVQKLFVILNQPQTSQYGLQILSEMVLPQFPSEIELPVIVPEGGIRAGGFLAIGTDSALHLVVKKTSSLSQVDAAAFPRIMLDRNHPRLVPTGKVFYYTYAALPYQMSISLDDIVPSFDASEQLVVSMLEDDLTLDAVIDLDVRDAPIRSLIIEVPAEYSVADVSGAAVKKDDYTVREMKENKTLQEVEVHFTQPVLGRTLLKMRLELSKGPLGKEQQLEGISIRDAKNERGYLVVVAEEGVQLETPKALELREVHTGSVPMRVANAQYAYRFRQKGWTLKLMAEKKPSSIRVEAFHLVSIGDEIIYGSVALNYFISGAPVDELHFRVPPQLENPVFVGNDISRPINDGGRWIVKLQRKVIGDYNLGITYNQRFDKDAFVPVGGVQCERVQTQTGYITVASHLNMQLSAKDTKNTTLLEIDREELPSNYRLLVNAPVLKTYKYVNAPQPIVLTANVYSRGTLVPAVIEAIGLTTTMSIMEDGELQSMTTVRYKVKNASVQFLMLDLPEGANVWTAHLIERDSTGERATRLTPSFTADKKLMIPLRRNRNANEPETVQVEYGQAHAPLSWRGLFGLAAPGSPIRSTFATWQVNVPKDWAVLAEPELSRNMVPEDRRFAAAGLPAVLAGVLRCWVDAMLAVPMETMLIVLGVIIAVGTVFYQRKRELTLQAVFGVLLAAVMVLGILATQSPRFQHRSGSPEDLRTISFTQVLGCDEPLKISAYAVPYWRSSATLAGAVIVPIVSLAMLAGWATLRRRERKRMLRRLLAAAGLSGLAYGAAQFPDAAPVLCHVFTWGLPLLLVIWFLLRVVRRGAVRIAAVPSVAAMLLAVMLLPGCITGSSNQYTELRTWQQTMVEDVDCQLLAEKDSMAVTIKLRLDAPKPSRVEVLSGAAILLSPEKPAEHLKVQEEHGRYYVLVEKPGRYEVELKFVSPLTKAADDQVRGFRMPMPLALTNRVQLTVPATGMQIEAPTAIRLLREETADSTVAKAILGPGNDAVFAWKPRARQTQLEATSFLCETTSVVRFDTGVAEGRHRIRFQIAQGELREIQVTLPENVVVTLVEGPSLGAWRFDPARHVLEAKLSEPAREGYTLNVVTQTSAEGTPYEAVVGTLKVEGATSQRGTLGVIASSSVFIVIKSQPQPMNVDDFARGAQALLSAIPGVKPGDVRNAYRVQAATDVLTAQVSEVRPEIRTQENSVFTVADDRLVYNGEIAVEIIKAGRFSIDLRIPVGYDIDTLGSPEVSHWDENVDDYGRTIQVHFRTRLMGRTALKVAMSRPESELPREIRVPRVEVLGSLKHTGQIAITLDRGVRLAMADRKGVSELNPLELGLRGQGSLAFKLLKPDWELTVHTEVIKPRVTVDFLHVAKVTEGLVRHTHHLTYRLENAGSKMFEFEVPKEALGLLVTGPDIARRDEVEPGSGRWRIELAHKWERPYPLRLDYETQFDREAGDVKMRTAKALGADLQSGHVVVFATDRVELATQAVGPSLQVEDARGVPGTFGTGDLSGAAFCYASASPEFELSFVSTRHRQAALLEAEVLTTTLTTVVNELGESINRVELQLSVGGKRHLEVRLPPKAEIWSLLVNRKSTVPSNRKDADGAEVVLVPLAQAAAGELPVNVDFVYILPRLDWWRIDAQQFQGPQFDLPLKQVAWRFYLPERMDYYNFGGTLTVNDELRRQRMNERYDIMTYETGVQQANAEDLRNAMDLQ